MQESEIWALSSTSKPMPKWFRAMAIVFGCIALHTAYKSFSRDGLNINVIYNLLGIILIYGAGISRKLYLSDEGVVREMHSWGRIVRRVLPWDDIRHVSLAFRGKQMMAFFEVDVSGWKVPFYRDQEDLVREILEDVIPDIQVDTIGR